MTAVGKRGEECGVLGVHLVAEAMEFQIVDDALLEQAGEIGCGRDFVARPDFLRDTTATHQFAFFEHQDRPSGAREVCGGNQSVMAAADNDCVVFFQTCILPLVGLAVSPAFGNAQTKPAAPPFSSTAVDRWSMTTD